MSDYKKTETTATMNDTNRLESRKKKENAEGGIPMVERQINLYQKSARRGRESTKHGHKFVG